MFIFCVLVSVSSGLLQRFTMFNGGFSKDQLDWLGSVLSWADDKRERVTLVSKLHIVLIPCIFEVGHRWSEKSAQVSLHSSSLRSLQTGTGPL